MKDDKKPEKTRAEKRQAARAAAAAGGGRKRTSLKEYFKGVRFEMRKVVWPDRQELVSYTGVVILTCFVFAVVFWAFDTGFLALLKAALNITI